MKSLVLTAAAVLLIPASAFAFHGFYGGAGYGGAGYGGGYGMGGFGAPGYGAGQQHVHLMWDNCCDWSYLWRDYSTQCPYLVPTTPRCRLGCGGGCGCGPGAFTAAPNWYGFGGGNCGCNRCGCGCRFGGYGGAMRFMEGLRGKMCGCMSGCGGPLDNCGLVRSGILPNNFCSAHLGGDGCCDGGCDMQSGGYDHQEMQVPVNAAPVEQPEMAQPVQTEQGCQNCQGGNSGVAVESYGGTTETYGGDVYSIPTDDNYGYPTSDGPLYESPGADLHDTGPELVPMGEESA